MSQNKVKFGLKNVYYAKATVTDSEVSYATPIAIPGAVNITLDAEGDETDFYADNVKYYNTFANNGYKGDLEVAQIPDVFRTDILGETIDANGALIESADVEPSPFALMFQIEGDKKARRFVYYNNTVSRPSVEGKTTETSKEVITDTLSITASPRTTDNKVRAFLELSDDNQDVYDTFFDKVYEEGATVDDTEDDTEETTTEEEESV